MINIKLATQNDLKCYEEDLIKIIKGSLIANNDIYRNEYDVYKKMLYYFEENKTKVWLAFDGVRVVGYAQFFQKNDKCVHLNEIAVTKDYEGLGIGSILLKEVEKSAKEMMVEYVELFCAESNSHAKRFYDKQHYFTEKRLMLKKL